MRKHLHAASATLAASILISLLSSPGTAHAQAAPGRLALGFIEAAMGADGSVPGFSKYQPAEDAALGAAALGVDPRQVRRGPGTASVIGYLEANAAAAGADPGNAGRLLEVAVAAHLSPSSFGGVDLVRAVTGAYDPATGRYGDGEAFTQALALLGLRAAGAKAPPGAAGLAASQDGDGGWNYLARKDDPLGFGSDTNSTAMVLMALDAAGDHSRDAAALAWLRAQQQPGGFAYQADSPPDPDSTALVVQAITAAGQDPAGPAWSVSGVSAAAALAAMQASGGGFSGFAGSPDPGTTSETLAALASQPFPVASVYLDPAPGCSAWSALHFLAVQVQADGSLGGSPGETEDAVLGAAAAGYDPALLRDPRLPAGTGPSALDFLTGSSRLPAETATAGATAKLILALHAAGLDPAAYRVAEPGQAPPPVSGARRAAPAAVPVTLVQRLLGFGKDGLYAPGDPFSQSLAVLALVAAPAPDPAAVRALAAMQLSDGGFGFAGSGDTNTTSLALMALGAAGGPGQAAALAWLLAQRLPGGGFPFQAGSPSDPDSDALALQALAAANPDGVAAGLATADLLRFQDPASGGFTYPGSPGPDAFTTSEVPAGLERAALPVGPGFTPGAWLGSACPFAVPPAAPPPPTPVAAPSPAASPPSAGPRPETVSGLAAAAATAASPTATPSPGAPAATAAPAAPTGLRPPAAQRPDAGAKGGGGLPFGLPPPLVYGLVALAALALVGGAGTAAAAARR